MDNIFNLAFRCECSDLACPHCMGLCKDDATVTLYRVDMVDATGTEFCEGCANDAMESGLFDTEKNFYS